MLKSIGVIPARFNSSRFPGKPLKKIAGKALIERVYERASLSKQLSQVIVATDDQRIFDFVNSFGGEVVMTSNSLETGSDRVWEAIKDQNCDIVVNIQGDEPLIEWTWLDQSIQALADNYETIEMVTLAVALSSEELSSKDVVKVVTDIHQNAIYFSRYPIPFSRLNFSEEQSACFKHMGIYVYKKSFLQKYCSHPITWLEQQESLEQLRALYLGAKIKIIEVQGESIGVDNPGDVKKVEEMLKTKGWL